MNMLPDEERSALAISYHAARLSVDPRTQNGAYLINDADGPARGAIGHNMAVRGATVDWEDPDSKYNLVHHAEESAVHGAAVHGIRTWGSTLFVPWYCCLRCARTIVGAKVHRVVGHRDLMRWSARVNPRWAATTAAGLELLANANIECVWIDGPVKAPAIRHGGWLWNPDTLEATSL